MITTQAFYKGYQLHHHRAKASAILKLLENKDFYKAEDILDSIWAFNQDDYERMLKIEMRTNLFHAIETLFTLFFCLQPDSTGKVDDLGLFQNLNKKTFYYEQIRGIAHKGESALNALDEMVIFNEEKIKLGQYLFYYSFKQDKFPPGLDQSLDAIKYALVVLANELSDTSEYNSYKHSLRSIPAFSEFSFAKASTMEIIKTFDAKDTMTYFQDYKNGSFSYKTKTLDTTRDFQMTILASNIIYNIIMFRRASIVRDLPEIPVSYFDKAEVEACAKHGNSSFQLNNTFTPTLPKKK